MNIVVTLTLLGVSTGFQTATVPQSADVRVVTDYLAAELPGYRLVRPEDFVPALKDENRGQSLYRADFNGDGQTDYAALVMNAASREARIYYLLGTGKGFQAQQLLSRHWSGQGPGIRTPIFFKAAGEEGLSARSYNTLTQDDRAPAGLSPAERLAAHQRKAAPYVAVPAIEAWVGENQPSQVTFDEIAYCSDTWYYQAGQRKMFKACD